jgi:uncharacterized protein YbaP (TraB family)
MIKKQLFACLVLVFVLISNNIFAQAKYPSILWEVKKSKTAKPSYLFGTYHISSKGVFKLGDSIFYALKNVDIVAKELNANNWQREQNTIDEMQSDYARYNNNLRNSSFGKGTVSRTNTVEKLPFFLSSQPNFINYFLSRSTENEGFEEEMFLDKFISSAGYKYGKEIKGLENYMESTILYLQAQKDQADLEKTDRKQLPDGMNYKEMYDKIYDGYLNHNLDALDSFMVYQFESEAFYNKFLKERNYNQADSMDYYIKTGKAVFAAVGAAHLPGKDGVIEILRRKGYFVRPIKLNFTNTDELEAVKKIIVPLKNKQQNIDDVMQVKAPGEFYVYEKTDILKSYGYVDMINNSFYYISRLYNNAAYFGYDTKKVSLAVDSLLFSNIKGNIVEKTFSEVDGYTCVNVTTKVKNKDIERYKFVITPYEIIKFQVGGKDEFAKSAFVDEFFNSIKITAPQKLSDNNSFAFKENYPFHTWNINNTDNVPNKQKYTYYDAATNQLNSCIKVIIPEGKATSDSLVSHIVRESFLSSESFSKEYLYDDSKFPLASNKINNLKLIDGQNMLLKYQIKYPYVYILSSVNKAAPTPNFINAFELKDYSISNKYNFVDSSYGYKITLPYNQSFDKKWKYEMERVKKKYDDEKSPNDYNNLFYRPANYGENSRSESLSFEDPINMEGMKLTVSTFDKDLYYTSAAEFWKKIISPFNNEFDKKYSSRPYRVSNDDDYWLAKKRVKQAFFNPPNFNENETKIEGLVYDTANNKLQTVYFYEVDSVMQNKTFHQFKLTDGKLFHIFFTQYGKEKTAFQKLATESFAPLQVDKPIQIYKSKFSDIINEYQKANVQKRANVLKKLNNLFLGTKDLKEVDAVFKKNTKNVPEENILRRKLMDMVANGLYSNKEWQTVSSWLKNIFANENELVTLRSFALKRIISESDSSDAAWIVDNMYKNNSPYQKNMSEELNGFLQYTSAKPFMIPRIPLILKDKSDFDNLTLIDSGYYTIPEKEKAFEFYKKTLDDEILDIKLSQEKNNFEFNESEINETLSSNSSYGNFTQLVKAFDYFYSVKPNDLFFEDALKKILDAKSDKDLISLLYLFLKQDKPDYTKVDKIVAQLGKDNNNLFQINEAFETNKKYDKLAARYKDKKLIAKYYLLKQRSDYNKLDSLTFIGAEKYSYAANDSIYFFKYISDKEKNSNIAYVVLDSKNEYLKNSPDYEFTSEQITAKEPYKKVVKKIMRQNYTNTFYNGIGNHNSYGNSRNYGNYSYGDSGNDTKSLNSEE